MHAGFDFGSTLVKAAFEKEGFQFLTTADNKPLEEIIKTIKDAGVLSATIAGQGYKESFNALFDGIILKTPEGDPIKNEIELQATGARKLLELEGKSIDEFLLVSIGTGTSYTFVRPDGATHYPLGNPIGGGFIRGMARIMDISPGHLAHRAQKGKPADLLLQDILPLAKGTPTGELVASHLAKANDETTSADKCASVINIVATLVTRDILMLESFPHPKPKHVVYIGSPIERIPSLRSRLEHYQQFVQKEIHFPNNAAYALALGAYLHRTKSI